MSSGPTTFATCVVFTAERFQGNPLAIVAVRADSITEKKKSLIAKEFGYSETIFIHDAPGPGLPRKVDIFTEKGEEIPFAGHPIIGAAHYIFALLERMTYSGPQDRDTQRQTAVFMTKAGPIPVFYNPYRQLAACTVPHKFHVHSKQISIGKVTTVQPQVQIISTVEKLKSKSFPIVSIVKGMTFVLVDLTDAPEVLAALEPGKAPEVELDEEWKPTFVGCMYYKRKGPIQKKGEPPIVTLQCRMITEGMEDPGTGSASCALACYLATEGANDTKTDDDLAARTAEVKLEDKLEHSIYAIEQGIEMGRKCTIAVEVDTRQEGRQKKVESVILSGRANFMLKGEIFGE